MPDIRFELEGSPVPRPGGPVRTPGWIVRATAVAFLLVVALPVILLLMFALLIASVLFGILWLGNRAIGRVRVLGRSEGRENVRVIRRDP